MIKHEKISYMDVITTIITRHYKPGCIKFWNSAVSIIILS